MRVYDIMLPLSIIVFGILVSVLIEHLLMTRLKKATCGTTNNSMCVIISVLKGYISFWILLGALFTAYEFLPELTSKSTHELLQKIFLSITVSSITLFTASLAAGFIRLYGRNASGQLPTTSLVSNITRIFIYIGGGTILLQLLGVSITPLITALGVGGLAVALALQDTLSNLFAGIHILAAHNIHTNDYVRLASGEEGYISDITWRNTVIRTMAENNVIVPNTQIATTILTNYSHPSRKLYAGMPFAINPEVDLELAERIILEETQLAMETIGGAVKGHPPTIRFQQWTDSRIEGTVWIFIEKFDLQFALRHECIKRYISRFKAEGLPLPYATRALIVKDAPISNSKEQL